VKKAKNRGKGEAPAPVNKRQMAAIMKISVPTLEAMISRYGSAFPVTRAGSRGVAWQFNPRAVLEFVGAVESRNVAVGSDVAVPSIAVRLQQERLRKLELENRQVAGQLVSAAETLDLLSTIFGDLSAALRDFIRQIAREQAWPDAILNAIESRLADLQRGFVARTCAGLGGVHGEASTAGEAAR